MIPLPDGSRGRISVHLEAAGQVFMGSGYVRGILFAGISPEMHFRDGTDSNAEDKIHISALSQPLAEYVMCDIYFDKGCYLDADAAIHVTVFYD